MRAGPPGTRGAIQHGKSKERSTATVLRMNVGIADGRRRYRGSRMAMLTPIHVCDSEP
jgi:hypothetical protein